MQGKNAKCKAWIKADGKFFKEDMMIGPESITQMMNHQTTSFPGYWCFEYATFLWFTGKKCKNKNGELQEVYDGDIIEFDRKEWGGDDNIFVVSWNEDSAGWSWGGGSQTGDWEYRTIIGNIYQNPELIPKLK